MKIQFDVKNINVLIVDDHAPIRKAIKRVINDFGFKKIFEASNGNDALEMIEESNINFVILDLFLPEIHGFDIIKQIRDRDLESDLPILVVTGEASRDDIVKSADLGADGYLLKPFQAQQLTLKVIDTLNKFYCPSKLMRQIRIAESCLIEEEFLEANEKADEALETDPDSMRARHLKALALLGVGETKSAITMLHQNIAFNPSFFKSYRTLSNCQLESGFKADGIETMRKELELNPKQPLRQLKFGKLLLSVGQHAMAIEHFREALKENQKLEGALMGMGRSYALSENLEKAFYYFKRLRRDHPKNTKSLEAMVKYALDAKEFSRAEMALRDEKSANPKRIDTYIVLSKLYASARKLDLALKTVEDALKLKADNLDALKLKGDLLALSHKTKEAIAIYITVLKRKSDPVVYSKLARAYLKANDFSKAIASYHRLLEMHYDPAGAAMGLGEAYLNTEQYRKAIICFKSANRQGISSEKLKALMIKAQRTINASRPATQRSAS